MQQSYTSHPSDWKYSWGNNSKISRIYCPTSLQILTTFLPLLFTSNVQHSSLLMYQLVVFECLNVSQRLDQSIINKTLMTVNGSCHKDQSNVSCLVLYQVTRHANLTIWNTQNFWYRKLPCYLYWNVYVCLSNKFLWFFNINNYFYFIEKSPGGTNLNTEHQTRIYTTWTPQYYLILLKYP